MKVSADNPLFQTTAERHGLEVDWLRALATVESTLCADPKPRWEPHLQEHSYGICQVLPSTAMWMLSSPRRFKLSETIRNDLTAAVVRCIDAGEKACNKLYNDPAVGLDLGAAYLAYQLERYGSIEAAVAAYNAGSVRYKGAEGQYVNQHYVEKWKEALDGYRS
jgi:soluble lytic murein transglycosylase-like protein